MSTVHVRRARNNVLRCMETYTHAVVGESGDTKIPRMKMIKRSAACSSITTKINSLYIQTSDLKMCTAPFAKNCNLVSL